MPYLKIERREHWLDHGLSDLTSRMARHGVEAGDLNYIICNLAYMALHTKPEGSYREPNYEAIRNVLAEIREAEQEIRRRVLVPYEEDKRAQNGDVFDVF